MRGDVPAPCHQGTSVANSPSAEGDVVPGTLCTAGKQGEGPREKRDQTERKSLQTHVPCLAEAISNHMQNENNQSSTIQLAHATGSRLITALLF